jgi:hypothetical protein
VLTLPDKLNELDSDEERETEDIKRRLSGLTLRERYDYF